MITQTDHGGSVVSRTGVLGVLVRKPDTLATATLEGLGQEQGLRWLRNHPSGLLPTYCAEIYRASAHRHRVPYPKLNL